MATNVNVRRRLSGPERREQVLDAARELVGEAGFHRVSIESVAARAGISRPIVYEHFGDLAGLLAALVERESARALRELAEVLPTDLAAGEPRELLVEALRGYLEAVGANPTTWRLVLMPAEGAPEVLHERIAEGRTAVIALLAAAIGADEAGRSDSPDPELTARMLSAMADESARLLLADPRTYSVERIVEHAGWGLANFGFSVSAPPR